MKRADVLSLRDGVPDSWPATPENLSEDAAALEAGFIWARLEGWCGCRWTPRTLTAIAEGPGELVLPIGPVTVSAVEVWREGWQAAEAKPSPLGLVELDGFGPWRVTGIAGSNEPVPEIVLEAYRRLAEYFAGAPVGADVATVRESEGDYSYERPVGTMSKALILCGAADLLRGFRRIA